MNKRKYKERSLKIVFSIIIMFLALNITAFDKIRIALSSAPANLNPFFSTDANSQNINRLIHVSLIEIDKNMNYVCDACDSYVEKFVGSKHVLEFTLKQDLKFSDNSQLTSRDVENSWKYFSKDQQIKSTFIESFENIESVVAVSKFQVKIIFNKFSLENISNLTLLKILKITKENHDNLELENILGAGEYHVVKTLPLEIELAPKLGNKSNLVFKVVKDETTLALKLINNEIDLSVASMSPRKVNWLKNQKNLKAWNIPSANYIFLGMNQKRQIFQDISIRKAISSLIPREDILKHKLKNTAVLSTGMFSPSFKNMYVNRISDTFDLEMAHRLFEQAGYKKNKKGFYSLKNVEVEIDWKVSNNKASIETVEVLKYFFEKFGIKVNVSILEWGTYMSNFKAGKFDVVVGQWIGFSGPDMLKFVFHSENIPPKGGNRISYNNPNFDKVVDMATVELNELKRNELYKSANKIVTEDYAYVSLWHPNVIWIGSHCLQNVELEPTGSFLSLPKLEKICDKI